MASTRYWSGVPNYVGGAQRPVWVALAGILVAGFALRVLVGLLLQDELYGVGGKTIYTQAAAHLLAGNGFAWGRLDDPQPLGFVQPLYALFLAAQIGLLGFSVPVLVLCSAAVSTLTLWATYLIGRRVFGPAPALVGAALLAVHPLLIWFQMLRLIDTVLTVWLLAIAVLALLRAVDSGATLWRVALAGAAFGVYSLTRIDGFYFVLVAAAWLALTSGALRWSTWTRVAVLLLAWGLVVTPYVLRNWQAFGALVLSTNEGISLFLGHNPAYANVHPNYDVDLMEPHVERLAGITAHRVSAEGDLQLREAALRYIWEHPLEELGMALRKLGWGYAWYPVPRRWENSRPSFDPATGRVREEGNPRPSWHEYVYGVYWVPVGLMALGGAAIAWWRRRSRVVTLLSLFVLLNAVELVMAYPDTRYRLAVEPYLVLFAGLGATYVWVAVARRWWAGRSGVAAKRAGGAGPQRVGEAVGVASEQV